jgi:phosphoribosylglycinamide formyltransferase-1
VTTQDPSTPNAPARLAVLISGGGRTMLNIDDLCRSGDIPAAVALVIASKPCPGADKARDRGIPVEVIKGEIPAVVLSSLLAVFRIDWVVLAGYLKKISIPRGYESRVVNIHPALLPDFGGPGMYGHHVHEAVLKAGRHESGCTVHLCDDRYDTGPIILQRRCPVLPGDTPETLARRVFDEELLAYPEALRLLIAGQTVAR